MVEVFLNTVIVVSPFGFRFVHNQGCDVFD